MRTRFAVGALLLVCGFAAACSHKDGDTGNSITGPGNPTPQLNMSATPGMLVTVTDTTKVTVSWTATNVASCSATWTTSTATSGTAVVVPTVSGIGQQTVGYPMTCTGPNGTVQSSAGITILAKQTYTATGSLHLANVQPGESSAGWTIKMTIGTDSVVGKIDASGNYTLVDTLSTQNAPASTVNVMIIITPTNSRYAPMYSSRTALASVTLAWVMIPNVWIKETGHSTGVSFPVGPDSLMANPGPGDPLHFLRVSRFTTTPQGIVGDYAFSTWKKSDFPIKVAYDSVRSTSPINAHAQANLKMKLDSLNAQVGWQMYVIASYTEVLNGKGIFYFVDSTLTATNLGTEGVGAAGLATSTFDANGNIVHVDIRFAYEVYLEDQYMTVGIITHEFLHGLGFGHTCGKWNSVMRGADPSACAGPAGIQVAADLDLVYLEMMYEVSAMQQTYNTLIGFPEWLNGSLVSQGKAPSTNTVLP